MTIFFSHRPFANRRNSAAMMADDELSPFEQLQSLQPVLFHYASSGTIDATNPATGDQLSAWYDYASNGLRNSTMPFSGAAGNALYADQDKQPTVVSGSHLEWNVSKTQRLVIDPVIVNQLSGASEATVLTVWRRSAPSGGTRCLWSFSNATSLDFCLCISTTQRVLYAFNNGTRSVYGDALANDDLYEHVTLCRFNGAGATNEERASIYHDTGSIAGQTWTGTIPSTLLGLSSGSIGNGALTALRMVGEIHALLIFTRSLNASDEALAISAAKQLTGWQMNTP